MQNAYLQTLTDLGLVGFAVLVAFFVERDNATVGKHDLRLENPVAGEAEAAANDPQSAPER